MRGATELQEAEGASDLEDGSQGADDQLAADRDKRTTTITRDPNFTPTFEALLAKSRHLKTHHSVFQRALVTLVPLAKVDNFSFAIDWAQVIF